MEPVVEGALQPAGTTQVTEPFEIPPVGAVYVNVIVRPAWDAETLVVGVVTVPEPSTALTMMLGEAPRLVSEPADVDFSWACQVCAPVDDVAVAPGPPLPVSPYVIVKVLPAARVTEETVMVCEATASVPALEVE